MECGERVEGAWGEEEGREEDREARIEAWIVGGKEVEMITWTHFGEEVEGWAWDEGVYADDMSAEEVYEEGTVPVGQYWW